MNEITTATPSKAIKEWVDFGKSMAAAAAFVQLVAEPGLKKYVKEHITDPAKQKEGLIAVELVTHTLYDILQALGNWAIEEKARLEGKTVDIPEPPPFTPPVYPKKTDDWEHILLSVMGLVASVLGEMRSGMSSHTDNKWEALFENLANAAVRIAEDWDTIFGLNPNTCVQINTNV